VAALLVAALLAGCTSPTPSPSASAPNLVPSPSSSASPSDAASPSAAELGGQLLEGFGYTDVLQVDVDGLAVRTAPDVNAPLATGHRVDGTSIGDVRLNRGNVVRVDLGPFQIGETTWYRVWPAEAPSGLTTISWDTNGTVPNPVEPGWVAASVGTAEYLSLHEAADLDPDTTGGLPLPLLISGIGDYLSEPQDGFDLYLLFWALAIDDQAAPCDFTVTLVPGGGSGGDTAVDVSLVEAFEEGQVQVNRSPEPYQLAVSSGCEWSLVLEALGHD
jgi:hypothetical protein